MQCEHIVCQLWMWKTNIPSHFQQKGDKKRVLVLHYLFHVSIGYLAVCAAGIYELEVGERGA